MTQRTYLVPGKLWVTWYAGHCALYKSIDDNVPFEHIAVLYDNSTLDEVRRFLDRIAHELGLLESASQIASGSPGSAPSSDDAGELAVEIVIHPSDNVTAEYRHQARIRSMRRHPSNPNWREGIESEDQEE